jgi:hypothetical protein
MQDGERLSLEQIHAFLEASDELRFEASDRRELYQWVGRTLVEQVARSVDDRVIPVIGLGREIRSENRHPRIGHDYR